MNPSQRLALVVGLSFSALFSCAPIGSAPKGAPRIEVEVVYEIDGAFYSPFDPGADAIAANAEVAERLQADGTITKYLTESRTKVEVKGRRGKAQGGWDQLRSMQGRNEADDIPDGYANAYEEEKDSSDEEEEIEKEKAQEFFDKE